MLRFVFQEIRRPCALLLLILVSCPYVAFSIIAPPAGNFQKRTSFRLNTKDDAFLEDLSRRSFGFFAEHTDPQTGLVADRAHADAKPFVEGDNHYKIASSAATGFGLSALCIAAERGWMPRREARERVRVTLDFYANKTVHERGWFYHFVNSENGERRWRSEISSIDTAILLGGILTARGYFRDDKEIINLATKIYERVDFQWMLDNHPTQLSHGWRPESGFIKNRWDDYSEQMMLILMAIGSPTHPITPRAWRGFSRKRITYAGINYMHAHPPLFIHQYSHAFVDFRGRRETWYPYLDYFDNSVKATQAHRQACVDLSDKFPSYSENMWGITASDSQKGYTAWGTPPPTPTIDGSIVPCAAGGSLMFTPEISLAALKEMHAKYGAKIYGRYGFVDAFNPLTNWTNPDVIGIDVGITLISAENLRTGFVWREFMRNTEITRAMDAVGLKQSRRSKVESRKFRK